MGHLLKKDALAMLQGKQALAFHTGIRRFLPCPNGRFGSGSIGACASPYDGRLQVLILADFQSGY